ncbi:MAG: hypothetical protein NZ455_05935 [Bacteroidia bacterium]|nr:hypothetical protein [Bacteroidia bacterium]MDW8345788.1 hypothetical protein [Bacteroidia bacterium]
MRRASRQAWCEAKRSPQHAVLAHTSAARRGQGRTQKVKNKLLGLISYINKPLPVKYE